MKLRYFVLVTLAAVAVAACNQSPTASSPRSAEQSMTVTTDTADRGGGLAGSGH